MACRSRAARSTVVPGAACCLEGAPLGLIVQHACMGSTCADIRSLFVTSKSVRATVLAFCHGLTHVQFKKASQESLSRDCGFHAFTSWLAKYGRLAGSLAFHVVKDAPKYNFDGHYEGSAVEQALATALWKAAYNKGSSSTNGLHLRSCELLNVGADISAALEQLPSHSLTQLCLDVYHQPDEGSCWFMSGYKDANEYFKPLKHSLEHLTNLRSLNLDFSSYDHIEGVGLDVMLPQLSALTNLTNLSVSHVLDDDALQFLPASLKNLQFSWDLNAKGRIQYRELRLGHLTSLTRLDTDSDLGIDNDSVLPGSLRMLHVGDVYGQQWLLPLQELEVLVLKKYDSFGSTLPYLSGLAALSHLHISYGYRIEDPEKEGLAWKGLPVKQLDLSCTNVHSETVKHLCYLTQLTKLDMSCCSIDCSAEAFAAALCELESLECLKLGPRHEHPLFLQGGSGHDSGDVYVFAALADLDNLEELSVRELPVSREAAQQLACGVAGQLSSLSLESCGLDDCGLNIILLECSQLAKLNVEGNPKVGDGVLPVAAQLPFLSKIQHARTGITTDGLHMFMSHIHDESCWCCRLQRAG